MCIPRLRLRNTQIILLVISYWLLFTNCNAQEQITITTYYPSPYGSYKQLETETQYFRETADGLVAFNYPDTTYDRRLRITAGRSDTADNDQGASIDLHGNNVGGVKAGDLDLVGGRGGEISFWTSPVGTTAQGRMYILPNGYVGIGTASPSYVLDVVGTVYASVDLASGGTKSFVIDHPTKPGMKLVHASAEGPEAAVFYRGEARLVNGEAIVELPDYFEALTRKEDRTVYLTAKGAEPYLLSASEVSEGKFKVYGTKQDGEFYWEVKAVRADVEPLRVEKPSGQQAG